jgi:hypothetical protein
VVRRGAEGEVASLASSRRTNRARVFSPNETRAASDAHTHRRGTRRRARALCSALGAEDEDDAEREAEYVRLVMPMRDFGCRFDTGVDLAAEARSVFVVTTTTTERDVPLLFIAAEARPRGRRVGLVCSS